MTTTRGTAFPLGSTVGAGGVNFALASRHASVVTLCLFAPDGTETRLPVTARTGDVWHIFVAGIGAGQRYGYRVAGAAESFNPQKLLLDPYTRAVDGQPAWGSERELARFQLSDPRDNAPFAPKSVVVAGDDFAWEDDCPPRTPWAKTVIYEMHVKGMSKMRRDLPAGTAGTFAALATPEMLRYWRDLGVTALEWLPISHHADEPHLQMQGRVNYWGYNVMAHFAPDPRFAATKAVARELKETIKTLHGAGLEVILDVVFNHSAENGWTGATLCQRGIDAAAYYFHDDEGQPLDFTGCGNSFDLNDPITLRWVMDALRYWVTEYHVDGFRFDLAAVLGRTPAFSAAAPFFSALAQDPILAPCKMIAEPWDIGLGGYRIGQFPAPFSEWNGRFRDDVRAFWLQDAGDLSVLATRFAGSADIFQHGYRPPQAAINFVTTHDGFTLRDLVSFNHKHNAANGEDNRDGDNHNASWNHGIEGETRDEAILQARGESQRALLATLLLAHGVPMLLAGDEFANSQAGNNNSYCQDNALGWLDWAGADEDLRVYVQKLLKLRQKLAAAGVYDAWWQAENARWLRADGEEMRAEDWHSDARAMMLVLQGQFLLLFNGQRRSQMFSLPAEFAGLALCLGEGVTMHGLTVRMAHLGVAVFGFDGNGARLFTVGGLAANHHC